VISQSIIGFAQTGYGIVVDRLLEAVVLERCNIYGNIYDDWDQETQPWITLVDCISAPPLFCDRYAGDVHVAQESSCLPENNPLGVLIGALGAGCDLAPETWLVRADGSGQAPTIQAAVDSATHGDTIIVEDGTYVGEGNYDIDFHGKLLVLRSVSGPASTVIDCQGNSQQPRRAFLFDGAEDRRAVVEGLTITGGYDRYGAGAFCDYLSSPKFVNCVFTGNIAWDAGGALVVQGSSPVFESCIIADNRSVEGGGIYCNLSGDAVFLQCTLVDNYGGGVWCWDSSPIIERSIVAFHAGRSVNCEQDSYPELSCSDVYGNSGGDWVGCIESLADVRGNFSLDPLFCDTAIGDFSVYAHSPCIAENNDVCQESVGATAVGCDTTSGEEPEPEELLPETFALYQNYPNPFNPSTTISFDLPVKSHVELAIYNILGQRVATLLNQDFPAGEHEAKWYGTSDQGISVASGVYLYRIRAEGFTKTRKMLLLK
jgi:hypothetical protein